MNEPCPHGSPNLIRPLVTVESGRKMWMGDCGCVFGMSVLSYRRKTCEGHPLTRLGMVHET